MAKEKKVEQITDMEVDFAQWYTDICRKAELVEYSSVKGFTILRPYGYAIWENMQKIMDGMFKETGHENVAMPVLIPESLLKKEGELVKGFAPETILTAVLFSMIGYFNGNQRTVWVMLQGLVQTLLVRLPMAYLMSIQPDASLMSIGLAAPASTAVGILLNVGFYLYLNRQNKTAKPGLSGR